MNPKILNKALLFSVIAMAISARKRIWYYLQPWPSLGKILFAIGIGIFVTLALLHGVDLLPEFLSIFGIDMPR